MTTTVLCHVITATALSIVATTAVLSIVLLLLTDQKEKLGGKLGIKSEKSSRKIEVELVMS